jgi:hypothetical protein
VVAGAVYLPVASIVPQPAPVQPPETKAVPEILQVTAWLALPGITLAVNCCTSPIRTVGQEGIIITLTSGCGGAGVLVLRL